ncbi:MAG: cytochrome C oxidase subunit IV family protein [Ignavibacteriaceae bacterium]|nr:cytochrome C oxidase subunit IV family protein [Ignavibacteriaceae bacterium]
MEEIKTHDKKTHSYGIYVLVWLTLVALTGLTAAVAGINFGKFSILVAILIAVVKSYLVLTEFMHLKSEERVFRVFALVALLFIVISLTLLFSDYSSYVR